MGVPLPWTAGAWQPRRPVTAGPQGPRGPHAPYLTQMWSLQGILRDECCLPFEQMRKQAQSEPEASPSHTGCLCTADLELVEWQRCLPTGHWALGVGRCPPGAVAQVPTLTPLGLS